MARQIVFQGNLDPSRENLTVRFSDAVAFVIDAPFIDPEYEIDCFLNIYIPTETDELVRVVNLGKIEEQAILLNIADTEVASVIPYELVETGVEMALLFLSSDTTFLQVTAIVKDYSLRDVTARLERLENSLYAPDGSFILDTAVDLIRLIDPRLNLLLEGVDLLLDALPEGSTPPPALAPAQASESRFLLGFGFN